MKVALCFSGKLGNWLDCRESIVEYLIKPLKPDIFLATWEDETFEAFSLYYRPKRISINSYPTVKGKVIDNLFGTIKPNEGLAPMLYNIQECNNLRKSYEKNKKIKYDLVIRIRPDILLHERISKKDIDSATKTKSLRVPYFESHNTYNHEEELKKPFSFSFVYDKAALPNQINDMIAVGHPEAIDKYSNSLNVVRRAVDFLWEDGYPEYFIKVPESVFTQCLQMQNTRYSKLSGSSDIGNLKFNLIKDGRTWETRGHTSVEAR
jgi:hypothetical protein